jgi:DNA-binding response OmpR family regulator
MGKKIVVIDDDKVTIKILEKFLLDMGFQVYIAEDGAAGYELVKNEKPDVLITDMLIPKIHGVELCRKIKENPELDQIKLILMTSVYKNGAYRSNDLECQKDGFLEKPLDFEKLKKIIQLI